MKASYPKGVMATWTAEDISWVQMLFSPSPDALLSISSPSQFTDRVLTHWEEEMGDFKE